MAGTTVIRNAAWLVAWDAAAGQHRYAQGWDLAFAADSITFVGRDYRGPMDVEIDGGDVMVMPGLVNIHCHTRSQPIYKGIIEELGSPPFYMSGLYDVKAAFRGDEAAAAAGAELAYCELLASGVTTLVDLCTPYPGWVELIARSGLRGVVGPGFASADWYTDNGHELKYRWNDALERERFTRAIAVMDEAERHPSGRLSAIVAPDTLDTCTSGLIERARALARASGRRLTIHCAESVVEFNELTRRFGKTPVEYAESQGLLEPGTILGHVIFIDRHSWLHWSPQRDLERLARSGVTVAHCPMPFARYGQTLEHFALYGAAGINLGLGTDTFPHNLLEEMRLASILGRVAGEGIHGASTAGVFHAATVGGATALGRSDIGRIAPGMKADLVLVDIRHPAMRPLRCPLRSLIYTAADRAVRDVYVGGSQVVEHGRVLALDPKAAAAGIEDGQRRAERDAPLSDYLGRAAEEIAPLALARM